jgi:hypothetical protein
MVNFLLPVLWTTFVFHTSVSGGAMLNHPRPHTLLNWILELRNRSCVATTTSLRQLSSFQSRVYPPSVNSWVKRFHPFHLPLLSYLIDLLHSQQQNRLAHPTVQTSHMLQHLHGTRRLRSGMHSGASVYTLLSVWYHDYPVTGIFIIFVGRAR